MLDVDCIKKQLDQIKVTMNKTTQRQPRLMKESAWASQQPGLADSREGKPPGDLERFLGQSFLASPWPQLT